ncbi:prenyltransferase/squalene oxidase repeat-containing protein [Streptomyces sp. NPDC091280]|uniref:prenyltransferase/squalene oxidase repeat-containing protein n=1 Tax=Streptomyces sp. NPDC091280 TaxID=3365984 RepID=UPI0038246D1B
MLAELFAGHGLDPARTAGEAFGYFRAHRLPGGAVREDPAEFAMDNWDNVHVLKAVALWRDRLGAEHAATAAELAEDVLGWLRTRENPVGVLTYGGANPEGYCPETTAEYVIALLRLGRPDEARLRAAYLRSRQRAGGDWEVEHPYLPADARALPSVTGFVLDALDTVGLEPFDLDAALDHLARSQRPEGHFGSHRWYYDTPLYFLRPVTAILARHGYHAAVAAARDHLLGRQQADGSWPRVGEDGSSTGFHTALALEALAHTGTGTEHPAVRRGVDWLLSRRRPDGSWAGGRYPDYPEITLSLLRANAGAESYGRPPQDVYATAQTLSTFHQFAELEARRGTAV